MFSDISEVARVVPTYLCWHCSQYSHGETTISMCSPWLSLVQCNMVIITNFIFWRNWFLKFWKRLWNHAVTKKLKLNNSNFKGNCAITIQREDFILIIKGKQNKKYFSDFRRNDNIALNQHYDNRWWHRLYCCQYYYLSVNVKWKWKKMRSYIAVKHSNYSYVTSQKPAAFLRN